MSSVTERVKDKSATIDTKDPSCGEGKPLYLQPSQVVRRNIVIDSRSANQNSWHPASNKNLIALQTGYQKVREILLQDHQTSGLMIS